MEGASAENLEPEQQQQQRMEITEKDSDPPSANPWELVSSDDEIDYSVKPEFYDHLLDEKDEQWINRQRKGRSSDAVLSCPACFTTLCFDCQRHERYITQYRAMFVVNCIIRRDQFLREQSNKRKPKKRIIPDKSHQDIDNDMIFWPVCCSVCSTEVAVFDKDELFAVSPTLRRPENVC